MSNTKSADRVIRDNEGLIYIALDRVKFRLPSVPREDLIQIGRIGIWKAHQIYKSRRGSFSTLALRCIINEMITEDRNWKRLQRADSVGMDPPYQGDIELEKESLVYRMEQIVCNNLQRAMNNYVITCTEKVMVSMLCGLGDYTYMHTPEEIATVTGQDAGRVKKQLKETMKKLRNYEDPHRDAVIERLNRMAKT